MIYWLSKREANHHAPRVKPFVIITLSVFISTLSAFAKPGGKKESSPPSNYHGDASDHPKLLRITGHFDGSGRIVFTRDGARYIHNHWGRPSRVTIDGEPWEKLENSPRPWLDIVEKLDLTGARIFERKGRDVVALEKTPDGFDLYISDSPNGASNYEIVIAIPRRTR